MTRTLRASHRKSTRQLSQPWHPSTSARIDPQKEICLPASFYLRSHLDDTKEISGHRSLDILRVDLDSNQLVKTKLLSQARASVMTLLAFLLSSFFGKNRIGIVAKGIFVHQFFIAIVEDHNQMIISWSVLNCAPSVNHFT